MGSVRSLLAGPSRRPARLLANISGPSLTASIRPRLFSTSPLRSQRIPFPRHSPRQQPLFFTPSFQRTHGVSTFFTPSHRFSTATGAAMGAGAAETIPPFPTGDASPPVVIPRSLPYWLFGCSALVFGIIVIGGLTRLTESGLSIVEWQPITGILPPLTKEDWDAEWEKYKVSPEGILTNSKIEMEEFKKIFFMEWAHRIAGRALGVLFVVPTIYYMSRYRLPRPLPTKLLVLGLGIGLQGVLGWYMVKSGLDEQIVTDKAVPRVSQYRLAAHLTAALALYIGMVQTAIGIRGDLRAANALKSGSAESRLASERFREILANGAAKRFKITSHIALSMVLLTAISGAFVAGLDAGLVYNEFPTMGGRLMPPTDELLDKRYAKRADRKDVWWRNIFENPVTAQFDHRLFATATFTVLVSLPFLARARSLRNVLPRATRNWANLTAAAAVTQVTLGVTTLLYLVPIPLAAMHQAGSVVLLTCLMGLAGSLRRPGKAVEALRRGLVDIRTKRR